MATYFKYAERSAESQVNWAEVGKNMTDMLKEQARVRQDRINALDESARLFGEQLANPPQGEHKDINQWGLEFGSDASEYMLMKQKLWRSGNMSTKDYLIGTQNIMDGTKQAFNLMKDFQASFSEKMERNKNDKSQDIELWLNAQTEKFGDFTKSQLYINPTDGTLSVAMKERLVIGGKEVFVMNKNPNDFATINSLRNQIAGRYDKYDTNAVTTAFADSLGKQETSQLFLGTLISQGKNITTEDIKSRVDLDVDGKTEIFKFMDAENQMIDGALENPFNRLSVLTNSRKFAENGKQYTFTYDAADAKANPEKVLLKIGQGGQPIPEFSKEQIKDSRDFMRTEVRAKYNYKQVQSVTPQTSQLRDPTEAQMGRADKIKDAENFGKNLGRALKSDDDTEVANSIIYLGQKAKKRVDKNGSVITVKNMDGTAESTFDLNNDPDKIASAMISAFGTDLPEDTILKFTRSTYQGNPSNVSAVATGFTDEVEEETATPYARLTSFVDENTASAIVDVGDIEDEGLVADKLNETYGPALGVEFKVGNTLYNSIYVVVNGKDSPNYDVGKGKNAAAVKQFKKFILNNYAPGKSLVEKDLAAEAALADLGILD